MSGETTDWCSVSSAGLLLSLLAPRGWEARLVDESRFGLFRDAEDQDGYRANVTFTLGEPEQRGPQWFSDFCEAVPGQLAAGIEAFELFGTDEFRLSSHARVLAVCFRQHATGAPATSHLQAYVWKNSYRMYGVTGATLRAHETRDLPIFDTLLRSLRVLPSRPQA